MADHAILQRRHMRQELARADDAFVAGLAVAGDAGMIVNPAGESSRRMTQPAIPGCRHVIE